MKLALNFHLTRRRENVNSHWDISISIRTDADIKKTDLSIPAPLDVNQDDDTVDCLALVFMVLSPQFSLVKSAA